MTEQEPERDQPLNLLRIYAQRLTDGEVVAFPTETFYGLLARIDRPQALARLFELKGRPADNPLPVIVADIRQTRALWREVPSPAQKLIDSFWPGPLTLVLSSVPALSELITADTGTVGARQPGSAAARGIAAMAGQALAATSANPADRPPATSPAQVRAYFGDAVTIADGPQLPASRGSTVIDLTQWPPVLVRAGDVPRQHIEKALGVNLEMRN